VVGIQGLVRSQQKKSWLRHVLG